MAFYQEIRYCIVPDPTFLIDDICQNFDKYNTAGCNFDNGACKDFNSNYDASTCKAPYPLLLGDGICQNFDKYNTAGCNFDNGDCKDFNNNYDTSACKAPYPFLLGDGKCDGGEYDTAGCNYDGGDCKDFNINYPNCDVDSNPALVGNGICDDDKDGYNIEDCGFDGGDCCKVQMPDWIGNGDCDGGLYNTAKMWLRWGRLHRF